MRKKPKVSIVMGAWNVSKYIEESVDSVLVQDLKDFELIIIEDCSTDNTPEVIKRLKKKDKRIRVLRNKKNLGLGGSLNRGIRASRGKYVAVLDSDDVALPNWLSTLYYYLEANKDVYLAGAGVICINGEGEEFDRWSAETDSEKLLKTLESRNAIWHMMMYRNTKEFFYRTKFRYAQDYDLFTQIAGASKKLVNLPVFLVKYRIHSSSASSDKRVQQRLFVRKISEFYRQRRETGKDEYESFDPAEIMNYDVMKSEDKDVLAHAIVVKWRFNDLNTVRALSGRYLSKFGFFNKFLVYFVLSFLGRGGINMLRKCKKLTPGRTKRFFSGK